jgi:hypothetical protein
MLVSFVNEAPKLYIQDLNLYCNTKKLQHENNAHSIVQRIPMVMIPYQPMSGNDSIQCHMHALTTPMIQKMGLALAKIKL